ncbi:hypothetical protein A2872_01725 [Candidatus Gottesmanbacteria bacterium RIFCSPHIGHO2_01_FULL_42_12]|uniref:DUF1059 domain-containing protein n=1 Tax=Candidatus Gottesmanbacteria bacterium RIFCSPHIGHO2_01_FULL_42_12 TaxID=1798377 RepID=A0A1F5Z5D1_9BACT|nr:MAG: hypothetical protein A2872_01725 [Candidatus Gottesmanbacteria bacterium RIFCSPHIGHO2_01_FULL_42_12]
MNESKEVIAMQKLYRISCEPECGFAVQSHDREETKDFAASHLADKHDMEITDKELEEKISEVDEE